eukprot:1160291-Pelagomonas_calceolata.AAC.9
MWAAPPGGAASAFAICTGQCIQGQMGPNRVHLLFAFKRANGTYQSAYVVCIQKGKWGLPECICCLHSKGQVGPTRVHLLFAFKRANGTHQSAFVVCIQKGKWGLPECICCLHS